jgi:hypothetical protein
MVTVMTSAEGEVADDSLGPFVVGVADGDEVPELMRGWGDADGEPPAVQATSGIPNATAARTNQRRPGEGPMTVNLLRRSSHAPRGTGFDLHFQYARGFAAARSVAR